MHTTSMKTIRCLLNIIVWTKGDKGAIGNIGNMYLESDIPEDDLK